MSEISDCISDSEFPFFKFFLSFGQGGRARGRERRGLWTEMGMDGTGLLCPDMT
jgi:hypothetical protein